jgi:hypothetical protein
MTGELRPSLCEHGTQADTNYRILLSLTEVMPTKSAANLYIVLRYIFWGTEGISYNH